jgi:hypothetical protein
MRAVADTHEPTANTTSTRTTGRGSTLLHQRSRCCPTSCRRKPFEPSSSPAPDRSWSATPPWSPSATSRSSSGSETESSTITSVATTLPSSASISRHPGNGPITISIHCMPAATSSKSSYRTMPMIRPSIYCLAITCISAIMHPMGRGCGKANMPCTLATVCLWASERVRSSTRKKSRRRAMDRRRRAQSRPCNMRCPTRR